MSKLLLFLLFAALSIIVKAQDSLSFVLDQRDPESVVNAVFYAASSGDFTVLEGLCHPNNIGNDDSKMICMLSDTAGLKSATLDLYILESGSQYNGVPRDSVRTEMKRFLAKWSGDFRAYFGNGRITSEVVYSTGIESIPNIPAANVPIEYFDLKGHLLEDTVLLVQENGYWYFINF